MQGILTEGQIKQTLAAMPKVKTWSREVSRAQLDRNAIRKGRRQEVEKSLSREGFGWNTAPVSLLLDLYWGIDCPILFKGWRLAIDITTNDAALDDKVKKLSWSLSAQEEPITTVDRTSVWLVNPNQPPSQRDLMEALSLTRRGMVYIDLR